jgi:cysteine-rich repeat protein
MHLDHTCIAKTCDTDQTCEAGTCGPKGRTPTPYPGANDAGNPRVDALQSTDAAEAGANDASADGNAPAIDGSPETGAAAPPDAQDAGAPDIRDSGAPDVPTMICGDGVISGTEICDDFNASACGTCNASCTSPQTLMPAIGSIIAVQASNTLDGETFTLADGVHAPVVFEFNDNVVAAGHVQIFRAASVSSQMAIKMAFAINSVGTTLQINAVVGTNKSQVLLTDINAGASGNIGITETVANGSFMITGMTGGTGRDCVLRVGCGSNDDCQSGSCCIGAMGSATCPCPSGTCATNTCVAAGP